MLIAALATYLFLADRVVAADKLNTMRETSDVLAATTAESVSVSLDAVADKLRYFGAQRPDPRTVFDAEDQLLALRVFEKTDSGFRQALSYRAPGAPEAVESVPPPAPAQLQAIAAAGVVVQNGSLPQLPIARVFVALEGGERIVCGDFRPTRLLPPAARRGRYVTYLLDGAGQVIAHPEEAQILSRTDLSGRGIVHEALKSTEAIGAREYEETKQAWVGSWARPKTGQLLVIAEAPREDAFKSTAELTRRALLWGAVMILAAVALSSFFARRVSRPLRDLERTIQRVSRGELGAEVEVQTANEIGSLAESFNQMSRELARRSQELDVKNAQLVQSEKMSAIGELSAGLAHEVKNPMVGIVGFAQLGQESTSLDEAREYFQLIDNDAQRANGILQNLLEFARPPDVETETLDFNQVVEGAVKLTAHQLQLNGV
jgi:signal transduction histidine kinase